MIDSYDWDFDYSEMTAAAAVSAADSSGLILSNHSYGYDALVADMGRYESEARSVDAVAEAVPYLLPFWAAGNDQEFLTSKGGYQSITFNGLAKNVLTVGAVDDAVVAGSRSLDNVTIGYFSSLGPCDDGRIKPDLVANGVDLYSSVASGDSAYDFFSGTSMAAPSAVGSAALVASLYAREFSGERMPASMLKGLLIHTADDVGNPGPDYTYGWGLINVKAAADLVMEHKGSLASPKLIRGVITNEESTQTHLLAWDGVSPIRATLCWTDPAGDVQSQADSRTPNLIHDLDVSIVSPDTQETHSPFVMPFVGSWTTASMSLPASTGRNGVDNVEQVLIGSPNQPGVYTVLVSLGSTLRFSEQEYSLILTGGTGVEANPPPAVTLTSPMDGTIVLEGDELLLSADASDLGLGGVPGSVVQVTFWVNDELLVTQSSAPY
ncbi:MAG: S8 family serine peptidase, partial [Luteolibacter sp.]